MISHGHFEPKEGLQGKSSLAHIYNHVSLYISVNSSNKQNKETKHTCCSSVSKIMENQEVI